MDDLATLDMYIKLTESSPMPNLVYLPKRVAILANRSLFAQGIASRFEQYAESMQVHFVDSRGDVFNQIEAIQPEVVLLSLGDSYKTTKCLLCDLMSAFPAIKIVRMTLDHDSTHVITSEKIQLHNVRDLLDLLMMDQKNE